MATRPVPVSSLPIPRLLRDREPGYWFNQVGHALPALSASAAKGSKRAYEDERLSLLGDSFPVNSFWFFCAQACRRWVPLQDATCYRDRLGLWPGACAHVSRSSPLGTLGPFGSSIDECVETELEAERLVRQLARRSSHNGSDIRITTGAPTNRKVFPRQSIPSEFWNWRITLSRKWDRRERINCLELRSILLTLQWRRTRIGLCDLAVKKNTLLRCKKALLKGLDVWDFASNFTSIPMLDLDISDYIEFSFEEGDSIGHIGDFLCGLQMYFPMVRNRLSNAWRMFKVWKKRERRLQATPIPPALLRGLRVLPSEGAFGAPPFVKPRVFRPAANR